MYNEHVFHTCSLNVYLQMSLFIHQIIISSECDDVVSVTSCPTTEKEWREAELRINCLECPRGVYHCVPDQQGNLVEVCTKSLHLPGKSAFTISWLYHSENLFSLSQNILVYTDLNSQIYSWYVPYV